MNYFYLFILLFFSLSMFAKNVFIEKENVGEVTVLCETDSLNRESTIYYLKGADKKDSIIIDNVDFSFDTLMKVSENAWKYIFSVEHINKKDIVWQKQIILKIIESKIQISYVGNYLHESVQKEISTSGYLFIKKYQLSIEDTVIDPYLKYVKHSKYIDKEQTQIDSAENVIFLEYNVEDNIYYNEIDTLNGPYTFIENQKKKQQTRKPVIFNNEIVKAIKFEKEYYIYYKNTWFTVTGLHSDTLIPYFRF